MSLEAYAELLRVLQAREGRGKVELPFVGKVRGVEALFGSLSAVAPAVPGARDEEWNPVSQRTHTPLPPPVGDELGGEITALKEAVDAFTTLSHEMMHVALWEPFFTGAWKPRGPKGFREFSLMAEGYCFFFSDIVVSGAVRVRLPDGEFALERQTPSNARFHPIRAFHGLGMTRTDEILDIYLAGFSGERTALWQPRGGDRYAAAMAAQVYDFYAGSQRYLAEAYGAIAAFGGMSEFHRRFCRVEGLPSFAEDLAVGSDLKAYFRRFHQVGLERLAAASAEDIARLRWRRTLQMRAYYALQVRWLLREGLVFRAPPRDVLPEVEAYLSGLRGLLLKFAPEKGLADLDADYDARVRAAFSARGSWVGERWLIAPRRAGGKVSVLEGAGADGKGREGKIKRLSVVAFLVDELTKRMKESRTVEARELVLAQLRRVAGATTSEKLRTELRRPELLELWSVPMTAFDPAGNTYRELCFSYQ